MLLVLCLSLAACGSNNDEAPEGYRLVSGDDVAYRFYAPISWSINSSGSIDSVYYSPEDPAMVMISFYAPDSEQADIDTYWEATESEYKKLYTDYELVSSGESTLGKSKAIQYTFTAKIGDNSYKIMQRIAGHGQHYYTMTYMASPETFDAHLEEVQKMADSFSFR